MNKIQLVMKYEVTVIVVYSYNTTIHIYIYMLNTY